jgi:hypothetical protein
VLGVKTRQLNGDFNYAETGVTDNQIRAWNHIGLFSSLVDEAAIPSFTKLVPVTAANATVEFRARAYLDANCSQCHRPAALNALFDARIDTPLASQGLINGTAINTLGVAGAKIIAPGETYRSALFLRVQRTGRDPDAAARQECRGHRRDGSDRRMDQHLSASNSPPPVVTLTSPANGASFVFGATFPGREREQDEWHRDEGRVFPRLGQLGESLTSPYLFNWSNAPLGTFVLRAVASDSLGLSSTSAPASVTITAPAGTNAWLVKVNFQAASAPSVPAGYIADYGDAFGDRGNGFAYGWNIDNSVNARYRNSRTRPTCVTTHSITCRSQTAPRSGSFRSRMDRTTCGSFPVTPTISTARIAFRSKTHFS